jgi:hypothetical protein
MPILTLRSHYSIHDRLLKFNPETGFLRFLLNDDSPISKMDPTNGRYSWQDGKLLLLYRHPSSKVLHLRVDVADFQMIPEIETSIITEGEIHHLILRQGKSTLYDLPYLHIEPFLNPFWPEDEEDANFPVWIHHVISDSERRQRMYTHWSR